MRLLHPACAVLAAGVLVSALASCSSSGGRQSGTTSSGAAGSSTSSTSSSSSSGCVDSVQAAVAKAQADPPLTLPTTPIPMSKNAGKTVYAINILTNQYTLDFSTGFKAAAEAAGMNAVVYDGKGQVTEWNKGIRQAIVQHASAIILDAVPVQTVIQSLKAATAAGIKIVDVLNGEPDETLSGVLFAHVTMSYKANGAHLADWMMADSGCKGDLGIIYAPDVAVWKNLDTGATDEIAAKCPACHAYSSTVNIASIATDTGRTASTLLTQHPGMKYLFPVGDSLVTFVAPPVKQSRPDVKVLSHDGLVTNLDQIRSGGLQKADIAFPVPWVAWEAVDQVARAMLGLPAAQVTVPSQLIDKNNIGTSNASILGNYRDFTSGYKKLWAGS